MRKSSWLGSLNGLLCVGIKHRLLVCMICVEALLAFQASRCFQKHLLNCGVLALSYDSVSQANIIQRVSLSFLEPSQGQGQLMQLTIPKLVIIDGMVGGLVMNYKLSVHGAVYKYYLKKVPT